MSTGPERKKRSETRRRTKFIGIRMTPDECTVLSLAAKRAGKSLPALLRDSALASINEEAPDAH